jgi:drug/metabolite transporter (DMT)-like permease
MFVTRPAFLFPRDSDTVTHQSPPLAVYCAIGGSFLSAVVYILLRRLAKVHHLVAIHYFFTFGSCTSVLTLLLLGVVSPAQLHIVIL